MYMYRNGGGSDILHEPIAVAYKVAARWGRQSVCSEAIRKLYIEQGLSTRKVALELGVSKTTVLSRLDFLGIQRRPIGIQRR